MSNIPAGGPFKAAMSIMETLSREHIRKAYEALKVYCSKNSDKNKCKEFIEFLDETSYIIARIRAKELGLSLNEHEYDGIDKEFFSFISKLVRIYSSHLKGLYVTAENGHVLVRSKYSFEYPFSDRTYIIIKNEYLFLPFSVSIILSSIGLVEPVSSRLLIENQKPKEANI